jgi:hypothetical protein
MSNSDDEQTRWRHDYDQRQYRRMLERLEAFEAGDRDEAHLVADLTTLLSVLEEEIDQRWVDEFSGLCCELEVISALSIHRGEKVLPHEDMRRACEIAGQLKRIVLPKIDSDSQADHE